MALEKPSQLFMDQTADFIRRKIEFLEKEASAAILGLDRPQVVNLIRVIDESLENYIDSMPEEARTTTISSLELLLGYYSDVADYVDSDIEELGLPDEVGELQFFGAFAISSHSCALEYLDGQRIPDIAVERFGSEKAASIALASEAVMDASQALIVAYSEFKKVGNHLSDVEKSIEKRKTVNLVTTMGGEARAKQYAPLKTKAIELYEELVVAKDEVIGEFKAAGIILDDLNSYAEKIGWFKNQGQGEKDLPQQRTVYNWLKAAGVSASWQETFSKMALLDAEEEP